MWFLLGSQRGFLVDCFLSRQPGFDQPISKAGHRNSFRTGTKIEAANEITPKPRRIPFRVRHDLMAKQF
jgi:hypothetical protein